MQRKVQSIWATMYFLVIISIVPSLAIILFSGWEVRDTFQRKAENNVLLLNANLASMQERITTSTKQLMVTLALMPEIRNLDAKGATDLLKRVHADNTSFTNILVANPDGDVVASSLPIGTLNIADRKHFQDAIRLRRFTSGEFIISRTSGLPSFPFALPVLGQSGEVLCVLTCAIQLNQYDRIYKLDQLSPGSFVGLTDRNGNRIYRTPPDENTPLGVPIAQGVWKAAQASATDSGYVTRAGSDGIRRITAFTKLRLHPEEPPYMYVFVAVPESIVTAEATAALRRNLALTALAAVLALGLCWTASRFLLAPSVSRLMQAAARFGKGDFSQPTGIDHDAGEFGLLAGALDQMAQERARAEEKLKASEERYALAVRGTNDGIWDWDMKTGEVYFSERYKNILGYQPDEMSDDVEEWEKRIHPSDLERVMRENGRCMRGEVPWFEVEYRLLHKDGSYRWVLGRGASLKDESGQVVRMAGAHTDITDRRRLQESIVHNEKIISMGGMAAGMAHEINNPLGGILQGTQVVLKRLQEDTPVNRTAAQKAGCPLDNIHGYLRERDVVLLLDEVRTAAARASQIVQNMLSFCRQETEMVQADMAQALDMAVTLCNNDYNLKKKYDFRRIQIVRDYQPDIPLVPCSVSQIEQVVINLLRNAAQAMAGQEGQDAPTITLRTRQENDFVRIEIQDNGPGLDEETRKRIFEPFFTTKSVGAGTGLGLSVSYFIVSTHHHGTIDVASAPGQGTTFIIRLPLKAEA
ncbi:ATP-binding protein [Fundidesulfovibrio putealis]|uniref:ATP-binding protein n=1 Tax=Fundidesulfovibrio putealis TaxID=270496 RepID=UPI000A046B53|nr:ATP-binding protein [Fundidesulfovibrio putealis]